MHALLNFLQIKNLIFLHQNFPKYTRGHNTIRNSKLKPLKFGRIGIIYFFEGVDEIVAVKLKLNYGFYTIRSYQERS